MKYLLFIILFLLVFSGFSQYTVLLMSGEQIVIRNYKYNDLNTAITFHTQNREVTEIDLDNIFSITDTLGNEQVIYKPDTSKEDFMTIEQMRFFVKGESDAMEKYKCPWCLVGGFVVGAASPFITPVLGLKPIIYSPLLPAAGSSAIGFTGASKARILRQSPELGNNEHYVLGYKEYSSQIRLKNTIIGSGIGLLVGILTSVIYTKNK
ncbi:MAG: hypothetical protein HY958_10380 [Bacteroidia bacterium]|nr:hypothetical protein [Bacteroidia bacterium]